MTAVHVSHNGRKFVDSVLLYANGDETQKNYILNVLCIIAKGSSSEVDIFRRFGYLENVNDLNQCGFIDSKSFLCRMLYNYVNYDLLKNYTTVKGIDLKEPKASYESAILKTLVDVVQGCRDYDEVLDRMGEFIP